MEALRFRSLARNAASRSLRRLYKIKETREWSRLSRSIRRPKAATRRHRHRYTNEERGFALRKMNALCDEMFRRMFRMFRTCPDRRRSYPTLPAPSPMGSQKSPPWSIDGEASPPLRPCTCPDRRRSYPTLPAPSPMEGSRESPPLALPYDHE